MRDALDLVDDCFANNRVGMADTDRQHAAEAVEIFVSAIVPDVKAFAADQRQRLLVISGHGREEKLFVFANSFGWRGLVFSCTHAFDLGSFPDCSEGLARRFAKP